jgi:hypothetical protein
MFYKKHSWKTNVYIQKRIMECIFSVSGRYPTALVVGARCRWFELRGWNAWYIRACYADTTYDYWFVVDQCDIPGGAEDFFVERMVL